MPKNFIRKAIGLLLIVLGVTLAVIVVANLFKSVRADASHAYILFLLLLNSVILLVFRQIPSLRSIALRYVGYFITVGIGLLAMGIVWVVGAMYAVATNAIAENASSVVRVGWIVMIISGVGILLIPPFVAIGRHGEPGNEK
jgi:hypothetical protein